MKPYSFVMEVFAVSVLAVFFLMGCGSQTSESSGDISKPAESSYFVDNSNNELAYEEDSEPTETETQYVPGQLICLAGSENEALGIADEYGIKLISFSLGVAVFETDENLDSVIQRGKDNNWVLLEKNYISHID